MRINTFGNTAPPISIFPRVHFREHVLSGAPPGSVGAQWCSSWISGSSVVLLLDQWELSGAPPGSVGAQWCSSWISGSSVVVLLDQWELSGAPPGSVGASNGKSRWMNSEIVVSYLDSSSVVLLRQTQWCCSKNSGSSVVLLLDHSSRQQWCASWTSGSSVVHRLDQWKTAAVQHLPQLEPQQLDNARLLYHSSRQRRLLDHSGG